MRKIIFLIFVAVLLFSTLSAEMILQQQPNNIYNYGDVINVPMKILATKDTQGFLSMNLICSGSTQEMFREFVQLSIGQEKAISPSIPILKSLVSGPSNCVIKATYLDEYVISNEFLISNILSINVKQGKTSFIPGETITIEGNAIKEDETAVNGFVEIKITADNVSQGIDLIDTVKNGFFSINTTIAKDLKAGQYFVMLNAYEKELGEISNQGFTNYQINIEQVPTNVEVYLEKFSIEPGAKIKAKAILHDQTGDKISSTAIITIKDNNDAIKMQEEKATDEFFEFEIPFDYPVSTWQVIAVSNRLTGTADFSVLEKKAIESTIVNSTLLIKNIGNVLYNDSVAVKIGNETSVLEVYLDVGQEESFKLNAPEGKYKVDVKAGNYSYSASEVFLTGKAIDVRRAGDISYVILHPFVWFFITLVLGAGAFLIFRKGYNGTSVAYLKQNSSAGGVRLNTIEKKTHSFLNIDNIANHSLSISGEKHSSSIVCIRVKELAHLKQNYEAQKKKSLEGTAIEALQKVINMAQSRKAFININNDSLLLIFSPLITRTFKNEKDALAVAIEAEKILSYYNKLAREKITFGVSISNGNLVECKKGNILEFMAMGNSITQAKKLASVKGMGVILDESIVNNLATEIKTQKHSSDSVSFHTIKEFKDSAENEKFIKKFVAGLEKDEKERRK